MILVQVLLHQSEFSKSYIRIITTMGMSNAKVNNDGIKVDYQRFQKGEDWQKQGSVLLF